MYPLGRVVCVTDIRGSANRIALMLLKFKVDNRIDRYQRISEPWHVPTYMGVYEPDSGDQLPRGYQTLQGGGRNSACVTPECFTNNGNVRSWA